MSGGVTSNGNGEATAAPAPLVTDTDLEELRHRLQLSKSNEEHLSSQLSSLTQQHTETAAAMATSGHLERMFRFPIDLFHNIEWGTNGCTLDGWLSHVTGFGAGWVWSDLFPTSLAALNNWEYKEAVTPFSSPQFLITVLTAYVASLVIVQAVMNGRKPFDLKLIRIVHNGTLCIWCFFIVVGLAWGAIELVLQYGAPEAGLILFCDPHRKLTRGVLIYVFYIIYLSKVYELGDTFIKLLRNKEVTFLHAYHHVITASLAWFAMHVMHTSQWIGASVNLTIHVFMYYFYTMGSLGRELTWKKLLTKMQIVQFRVDLCIGLLYPLFFILHPATGCSGSMWLFAWTYFFMVSLLMLFGAFYRTAYNPKQGEQDGGASPLATNKKDD